MTEAHKTTPTRPLTLDNHVARIWYEAWGMYVNAEPRTSWGHALKMKPENAFEAGIRAALSDRPEAIAARRAVDDV